MKNQFKLIAFAATFLAATLWISSCEKTEEVNDVTAAHSLSDSLVLGKPVNISETYAKGRLANTTGWTNGFSFPFGEDKIYSKSKDGDGWYDAQAFENSTTHTGSDWNIETGGNNEQGLPAYAAAEGEVILAEWSGNCWGNVVIIRHNVPGYSTQIETMYGHLSSLSVKKGDYVLRRQQIGTIGGKGLTCSFGAMYAHMHVEARIPTCAYWGKAGPGYTSNRTGFISFNNLVYNYYSIKPALQAPANNATISKGQQTLFWWKNWWLNSPQSRIQIAYVGPNSSPNFSKESGFASGLVLNSNIGTSNGIYITFPYSGTFYWSVRSADAYHATWFSEPRKLTVGY